MAPRRKLKNAATVSRNYLLALFDFSFTRYITIQMLPVVSVIDSMSLVRDTD